MSRVEIQPEPTGAKRGAQQRDVAPCRNFAGLYGPALVSV